MAGSPPGRPAPKISTKSMRRVSNGKAHLQRIQQEAQTIVGAAFQTAGV